MQINGIKLFNNKYKLIPLNDNDSKKSTFKKPNSILKNKTFILFFLFLIFILEFIILLLIKKKKNNKKTYNYFQNINVTKILLKSNRTIPEDFNDCYYFVKKAVNHTLINPNEIFNRSENPIISIAIPMYNAEGYIENGIIAIENQDFKDIEIIIIDDCSKDNSVEVVKQLMKKDPRINLYQNKETKGTLYSKSLGVKYSKGKYVLVSDQDDLYTQEDAFSTMYYYLEKYNLDILGFATLFAPTSNLRYKPTLYIFKNTSILHQPYIRQRMYYVKNKNVRRMGDVIWNYIYKRDVFMESISQIDDKIMNTRMNCQEDFLLFFLLTRNAKSLKNIKRIFYAHIYWKNSTKASILFAKKDKEIVKRDYKCLSHINYVEFLLYRTNNTIEDKRIASFEFNWYLNHECRNNTFIQERTKNVSKLFLENQYIEKDIKERILLFLNSTK